MHTWMLLHFIQVWNIVIDRDMEKHFSRWAVCVFNLLHSESCLTQDSAMLEK